jgi:hypothetical protein
MDTPVGAAEMKNRPGGRCFLPRSVKKQCLDEFGSETRSPVVLRLQGESVAVACSGRWAIALIIKPVPNVSADIGRLDAFW